MNTLQTEHPDVAQLSAFALGELPPDMQDAVAAHVAECPPCCAALRQVPDDTLLKRLRHVAPPGATEADAAPTAPPDPLADLPAELAGHPRYRILARLGEGGMGTVYRAEHRFMKRTVALKVINPHLFSNRQAIARFRQEVEAAARLTHPNIVAAHDADEAGGLHFLVMEYVEGINLARLVEKKGAQPIAHACHFVRQAALGLQHAHEQGMVHRDIKPHNLMVTRKGQVKVLDFGLARFARPVEAPAETHGPARALTAVDVVLGTPDYLAPEQAHNSSQVDGRADLYSLGCTLYYLLTGRVPFPGGSSLEKLFAQCEAEPEPVEQLRPDLPAELVAVVRRLMAKKPGERYQTAAEVAAALAPFARGGAVSVEQPLPAPLVEPAAQETKEVRKAVTPIEKLPTPRPRPRRKRKPTRFPVRAVALGILGLLFVCALAVFLDVLSNRADNPQPPAPAKPFVPPTKPASPWKKPDGKYRSQLDCPPDQPVGAKRGVLPGAIP